LTWQKGGTFVFAGEKWTYLNYHESASFTLRCHKIWKKDERLSSVVVSQGLGERLNGFPVNMGANNKLP